MPAIIYLITNTLNNKQYVGLTTKTLKWRWSTHCHSARSGSSKHFAAAIRKYGPDVFDCEVLEETTIDLMSDRERYWIAELQPAYNMTSGGQDHFTHSPETVEKIRLAHVGRKFTDEHRAKIAAATRESWKNPEARERFRESIRGLKRSAETRTKISASKSGNKNHWFGKKRVHSPETRSKISATKLAMRKKSQI